MVTAVSSPPVGKWYLSADEKYNTDIVRFDDPLTDPGVDTSVTIPVVMIQTGSARSALYPGIYRSPRVRTYSDKFGTPTTLTDEKEISFSCIITGGSMDDIYEKWGLIQSYFDRAEIASSAYPRGSGVVFVEQIVDAEQETLWDVKSGVITDADFNLPGTQVYAAVVQLTVLPFSRGRPNVTPFGSTLTNGINSGFYLPYQGGDAPSVFELRLSDQSAAGHNITWVGIGRRWYPKMSPSDFTPWYPQSYSITTSSQWQQVLQQASAPGNHQTGIFGVYAVVTDASPVIGSVSNTNVTYDNSGTLSNGFVTAVLAPKDSNGNLGPISPRIISTIDNASQPGDVQFYEGFEEANWYQWSEQPTIVLASAAASASLTIDATNPIVGLLSAHFKARGDTTSNSVTSASAAIFSPSITALGIQSIAFQIRPISWGTFAASSGGSIGGVIANPTVAPTVSQTGPTGGSSGIQPPSTPTLSYSSTPTPSGYPVSGSGSPPLANPVGFQQIISTGQPTPAGYPVGFGQNWFFCYTFTNANGETLPSGIGTAPANGFYPAFSIPSNPPAGTTGMNIYTVILQQSGTPAYSVLHLTTRDPSIAAGTLIVPVATVSSNQTPPTQNTTGTQGINYYWNIAYTWITPNGETTPSGIAQTYANGFQPFVQIPSFPAGVTGARIYAVINQGTLGPYSSMGLSATASSPGEVVVSSLNASPTPPTTNTTGTSGSGAFSAGTWFFGYTYTNPSGETTVSPLATVSFSGPGGATVSVPAFPTNATGARIYASSSAGSSQVSLAAAVGSSGTQAVGPGNGSTFPPGSNTTQAATAPSTVSTARFVWGSVAIVATATPNYFAAQIGGTQVGSSFLLNVNHVHRIAVNYQQVNTTVVYSVIVDDVIIGSATGSIGSGFTVPVTATWAAYGVGAASPLTEEWYLDEIYIYDQLLRPGYSTLGTGLTYTWIDGTNTATTDLYFSIQVTGETTTQTWYQLQNVTSPFRLPTPLPAGAVLVNGPPTGVPPIQYAQLRASVGVGSNPVRFLDKNVVRTKVANGATELVRLGSIELPPGSKAENRNLDGWSLQVWGKSGGNNLNTLTVNGIVLFPEDEDGWTGITAKAYGLSVPGAIWRIGTNRWGRSYGQIFANDNATLVGYADVSGAIGSMPGDEEFVVLTGSVDINGNVLIDLAQQFQLGCQNITRHHFQVTEAAVL